MSRLLSVDLWTQRSVCPHWLKLVGSLTRLLPEPEICFIFFWRLHHIRKLSATYWIVSLDSSHIETVAHKNKRWLAPRSCLQSDKNRAENQGSSSVVWSWYYLLLPEVRWKSVCRSCLYGKCDAGAIRLYFFFWQRTACSTVDRDPWCYSLCCGLLFLSLGFGIITGAILFFWNSCCHSKQNSLNYDMAWLCLYRHPNEKKKITPVWRRKIATEILPGCSQKLLISAVRLIIFLWCFVGDQLPLWVCLEWPFKEQQFLTTQRLLQFSSPEECSVLHLRFPNETKKIHYVSFKGFSRWIVRFLSQASCFFYFTSLCQAKRQLLTVKMWKNVKTVYFFPWHCL